MITYCDNDIRKEVQEYMKVLREKVKMESRDSKELLDKVVFTEVRQVLFDGKYVNRLVVFLRGTGCSLVKSLGGCTFCGFYNATNLGEKISDENYMMQIKKIIEDDKTLVEEYPIICLYNDGSMLQEEEINFSVVKEMFQIFSKMDTVKKIVIESKIEDITDEKVNILRSTTNKQIEIAVGFESANSVIRDLCINKSFENKVFETKLEIAEKYNVNIIPLMIVKPPFLTELEAIEDYIDSLRYLEKFNLKRIDMELPTVEKSTLVYDLWASNQYNTVKLWSVIEILKRKQELNLKTPIYISPSNYSVKAENVSSNCTKCNDLVISAFEEYNKCLDASVFDNLDCSCKQQWEELIQRGKEEKSIQERIRGAMDLLKN